MADFLSQEEKLAIRIPENRSFGSARYAGIHGEVIAKDGNPSIIHKKPRFGKPERLPGMRLKNSPRKANWASMEGSIGGGPAKEIAVVVMIKQRIPGFTDIVDWAGAQWMGQDRSVVELPERKRYRPILPLIFRERIIRRSQGRSHDAEQPVIRQHN